MEKKELRQVKKGEFFRLAESETAPVWMKSGATIRRDKKTKYECFQYEDVCHVNYFGSEKTVFVGFTY